MKSAFAALSLVCLLLAACATPLTNEAVTNADYGPPPSGDYQDMIKMDFAGPFIDYKSSVYTFDAPVKGYTTRNRVGNVRPGFGWVVCGTVSRKPVLSAYVGLHKPAPFFALFKDGMIVEKLVGQPRDNRHKSTYRINSIVSDVCKHEVTPDAPR